MQTRREFLRTSATSLSLAGVQGLNPSGAALGQGPRAYCVALSSAITVLIATAFGLPVSSTHIAVGAVFGVGFLREFSENPNRRRLRPGAKLNATAEEAFTMRNARGKRHLVRRRFVLSIAAAWVITVPASAALAATVYAVLQLL